MSSRWLVALLRATALVVFVAAIAWPIGALGARLAEEGLTPSAGWWPDARRGSLLGRSVALAAGASVAGVCLGAIPLAISRRRVDLLGNTGVRGLVAAALLFPPMVYQFGWDRLLPRGVPGEWKCLWTWALWSWPIPFAVLSGGWRRRGSAVFEAARLDASKPRVLVHIGAPILAREVVLSFLLLFALFFSDYGVPHACGLAVFSTEVLSWATSSSRLADTVAPSVGMVFIQLLAVALGVLVAARILRVEPNSGGAPGLESGRPRWTDVGPVAVLFALGQALPLAALEAYAGSWRSQIESWEVHGGDLAWSLATVLVAAAVVVGAAAGLLSTIPDRKGRPAQAWVAGGATLAVLALGACPGALAGSALIAAYNRPAIGWVYDHWGILSLAFVARFGWIACLVAWLPAARGQFRPLREQSETDGATATHVFWWIHLPLVRADLAVAFLVVVAMALAEVPATSLLRVPGFSPISAVLIECFHRLEDAKLAAISVWLMAAALPAILLVSVCHGRHGVRRGEIGR